MAEAATVTDDAAPGDTPLGDLTVLARDLHVYYRVYEDRRPRIGEIFARRFRRPGYREVKAVTGIDLQARQGESIGLIGRNGSGKSTLLRAVAGLLPPSRGEVYASSQPSLLGVSAALQPSVSGRRNILLGGLALGLGREEVEERMDEIIEWTGLGDFIDLPIRTYSSGMKARLHFAIATAVEPEILLIDEALSVGDEVFKERSKERIADMLDNAGTVFVCSHSMGTIRELCDRVIWLESGSIAMDGDAAEVVAAYKKHYQLGRKAKKKAKRNRGRGPGARRRDQQASREADGPTPRASRGGPDRQARPDPAAEDAEQAEEARQAPGAQRPQDAGQARQPQRPQDAEQAREAHPVQEAREAGEARQARPDRTTRES